MYTPVVGLYELGVYVHAPPPLLPHVTRTVQVAVVPSAPTKVATYVVPMPVGITPCVPEASTAPMLVMLPLTAFVLVHVRFTVLPSGTFVRDEVRVQVGLAVWANAIVGRRKIKRNEPATKK